MCELSVLHPIDSMKCIGQHVLDGVGDVVSSAFSTIFGGIVTWLTALITDAVAWMIKTLGTFWVSIGSPAVGGVQGSPSSTIGWMWAHLGWYTVALAVFSVLLGAGRMAITRRGQPGTDTLKSLLQFLGVNVLGIAVLAGGIEAADSFSSWIINESTGSDFTSSIGQMLGFSAVTGQAAIGLILVVILGLVAVLASLIQVVLMVMRSAMLVLLMTVMPLAAAATNTEMGKQWFRKVLAWTLAFLLYKPVASIIYALAFRLMSDSSMTTGDGLVNLIMGITMMIMALLGLPALMRFLVPAVSATAGGSGAGGMAAGAVATGAMILATGGLGAAAKGAAAKGAGAGAGPTGNSSPGGGGSGGGGGSPGGGGLNPTGGGGGGSGGAVSPTAAGAGQTGAGTGPAGNGGRGSRAGSGAGSPGSTADSSGPGPTGRGSGSAGGGSGDGPAPAGAGWGRQLARIGAGAAQNAGRVGRSPADDDNGPTGA